MKFLAWRHRYEQQKAAWKPMRRSLREMISVGHKEILPSQGDLSQERAPDSNKTEAGTRRTHTRLE